MANLVTIMGALALAGGGITYMTFPMGLEFGIKTFVNLKETGMVFPLYIDPPFAATSYFKLYEVKNPREALNGKRMKFNLKGPYVYSTRLQRDNVTFLRGGQILQYATARKLSLIEEKSANLDEKFWMLNAVVPTVLKTVKDIVIDRVPFSSVTEPVVLNAVNVLLDTYNERLFTKISPRILLEGRKVELLEMVMDLAERFRIKQFLPAAPPDNIFGFAYVQNETIDKLEIWTGVGAPEKFGDVLKWRDRQTMNIWKDKCNSISGTNGELHKPFVKKGKPIKVFLAPLCRTIDLDPVSDIVELSSGMKGLEYELSQRLYMGARSNPSNKCYCKDTRTYDCQFDGFISMGPCFFDTPIFFSRANLKGVDRRIRSLIEEETAIYPDLSEKQSFWLEPTTGTILAVNLTLVANVKVLRQPYMRDLAKIQNLTYVPLMVASEGVIVPMRLLWQVKVLQLMVDNYKPACAGGVLGGSAILLLKFLFRGGKSKKEQVTENKSIDKPTEEPAATSGE